MFSFNLLYIEPSVITFGATAIGSAIVAVGAFVAILWRRAKKKVATALNLEENSKKEQDEEITLVDENAI